MIGLAWGVIISEDINSAPCSLDENDSFEPRGGRLSVEDLSGTWCIVVAEAVLKLS